MIFAVALKTSTIIKHVVIHILLRNELLANLQGLLQVYRSIGIIGGPRKTYSQQHKHGIGRDKTHAQAGQDSRASGTKVAPVVENFNRG